MPYFIKPDMHHTCLRIMPCLCDGCLPCYLLSFRCCFFGLVPITSRLWGSIWLRPFVFFMDSFFFLAGFQARWPYPQNHFYLCLLVVRSIATSCYLPLAISCLPYCHVKPLSHLVLENRCLAMLPLLLSPSYSVASCRWRWSLFHVGTWICWDITISLIYLMHPYILVKGGRLGLMPGVLFHSCRPSFRHTGVMFLDFAFLTRLGDLWDPLDSSLWIKLLQQGPTLVLPFATYTFFPRVF